jgi:predicted nucleic acid-binding protein
VTANTRQREALLYPLDAIVLATAESVDNPLVSFDGELLGHDAVESSALLDE